ncbi:TPA: DUF5389 domain-containing protein [Pasteurella multocida]|uniref:DUF5389 domain-containing protein n=1 Tax=Pasteurella multocida TaxID=747 RepID=UPI0028DEC4F7|nr:DUF5389 domain-containing protein [Pasteurella multocida]MEB3484541.1 DUF5389 domain-containing protein [Pasteurella multocida]MEB3494997.1 DUF5389 domain-containing protein [Pasteurella multocida]HDR0967226.1 DUF5389 domain-containing protein [Pasteurella multocida]HDR0970133.1 DUF5389 domain-containing protein [Pasteurella multocida]HDR0994477.1 DUF5389 domain-containing protein [Pasteurella multocida]
MERENKPKGFSGFSWGIALFCLPILLWPLALTISPNLLKNPRLSETETTLMSVFLWAYPFGLALFARLAYHLNQHKPLFARWLLGLSAVAFYGMLYYVAGGFH